MKGRRKEGKKRWKVPNIQSLKIKRTSVPIVTGCCKGAELGCSPFGEIISRPAT